MAMKWFFFTLQYSVNSRRLFDTSSMDGLLELISLNVKAGITVLRFWILQIWDGRCGVVIQK